MKRVGVERLRVGKRRTTGKLIGFPERQPFAGLNRPIGRPFYAQVISDQVRVLRVGNVAGAPKMPIDNKGQKTTIRPIDRMPAVHAEGLPQAATAFLAGVSGGMLWDGCRFID